MIRKTFWCSKCHGDRAHSFYWKRDKNNRLTFYKKCAYCGKRLICPKVIREEIGDSLPKPPSQSFMFDKEQHRIKKGSAAYEQG